jgi:hypothetical protein
MAHAADLASLSGNALMFSTMPPKPKPQAKEKADAHKTAFVG